MDDSRGQIILVAALAIAVTFVALALIVNTVIFTENLATRETVDGQEAVAFDQSVKETAEALLARAHARNASADKNDTDVLVSRFKADIDLLSEAENRHALSGGSMKSIEVVAVKNGTRIKQSSDQLVKSDEGNSTWTVATDVSNTRRFNMNISSYPGTDPFTVNVTDGSSNWTVEVEEDVSGDYEVSVLKNGVPQDNKTITDSNLQISLTNGTVGGSQWSALEFGDGVTKPYDIHFENGSNVEATYQLVVDQSYEQIVGDLISEYGDGTDPTLYSAIYNTTIEYSFTRDDLHYSSNVTLAPEGPPPE